MPVFPCRHPSCTEFVKEKGGACVDHQDSPSASRHSYYDQHLRNPDAKKFYNSAAWRRVRAAILAEHPVCKRCGRAWATTCHHIIPLDECTPEQKLDRGNILPVCAPCHGVIEAELKNTK